MDLGGQEVRGYKTEHSKKLGLWEHGSHYAGMDYDDKGRKIRVIARYGTPHVRMLSILLFTISRSIQGTGLNP